jgi:hypothetical protein
MSAFHARSATAPVRFRSPAQLYPLVGFALLVIAFGLVGSVQDLSSRDRCNAGGGFRADLRRRPRGCRFPRGPACEAGLRQASGI